MKKIIFNKKNVKMLQFKIKFFSNLKLIKQDLCGKIKTWLQVKEVKVLYLFLILKKKLKSFLC